MEANTFLDSEIVENDFPLASKNKRLINYFIDFIFIMVLAFILGAIGGIAAVLIGAEDIFLEDQNSLTAKLFNYFFTYSAFVLYYYTTEHFLQGKSIGKYISKTRAVDVNRQRMTSGQTFKRSLCRIVPFDAFSFLGSSPTGWHDRWSDTIVVDEG